MDTKSLDNIIVICSTGLNNPAKKTFILPLKYFLKTSRDFSFKPIPLCDMLLSGRLDYVRRCLPPHIYIEDDYDNLVWLQAYYTI
jgi:hypothetical protein